MQSELNLLNYRIKLNIYHLPAKAGICLYLKSLVEADGLTHGGLDVDTVNVLPVLLEERNEEVERHSNVTVDVFSSHTNVTNGTSEVSNLLELELDGSLDFFNTLTEVISGGDGGRELTGTVKTGENTRDGLDENISGEESIERLSELLDFLSITVESLELFHGTAFDTEFTSLVTVDIVTDDTDLHVRTGVEGETERTVETGILTRIVTLERDLEIDSFNEVTLLFLGSLKDFFDSLVKELRTNLRHGGVVKKMSFFWGQYRKIKRE